MASSLIAKLVFFIATLFVASIIAMTFIDAIQRNEAGMRAQSELRESFVKTDFLIESFGYNDNQNYSLIYSRNIGSREIDIEKLSIYVDGTRIVRDENLTFTAIEMPNNYDERFWMSGGILEIILNKSLDPDLTYSIVLTDALGNSAEYRDRPKIIK